MNRLRKLRVAGTLCLCLGATVCLLTVRCSTSDPGGEPGAGRIRLLITDKPFPFDLIEEALITITRVEVRRAGEEVCETECDDAVFCNGEESCVDGECRMGLSPCGAGFECSEDLDACLKVCVDSSECGDGTYCNGDEACVAGLCASGAAPCSGGMFCDEANSVCTATCTNDGQCDDGLFCNGSETCAAGGCVAGTAPCADGEECDEEGHDCETDDGDADDDDEGEGSPFIVIFEGERVFNLLDLQNGQTDLLADAGIPAGTYTLMRLIVTEGQVTLTDGRVFPLTVPSGSQTGIKLHFTFDVQDGEETQLLLDVDMSRAFQPIPGGHIDDPSTISNFHFSPSVALRLINLLDAGSISGTATTTVDAATTPLAGVAVTAYDGDAEVTSTSTAADGTYLLGGLTTGTYRVEFSLAGYDDVVVNDVGVNAGAVTENVDASMTATAP